MVLRRKFPHGYSMKSKNWFEIKMCLTKDIFIYTLEKSYTQFYFAKENLNDKKFKEILCATKALRREELFEDDLVDRSGFDQRLNLIPSGFLKKVLYHAL